MVRDDPVEHVRGLLGNFRLLEAAGACGLIEASLTEGCSAGKPRSWWGAFAESVRAYRSAIHSTSAHGFSAIDDWSRSEHPGSDADLAAETTRLVKEHRRWVCDVPGGQAYVAWVSAYLAVAEIDGERAVRGLERCVVIVREFVDVPGLGRELSVYDSLQRAADTLVLFLPVPDHPLRDVRRFAFLPSPLRTGYGS